MTDTDPQAAASDAIREARRARLEAARAAAGPLRLLGLAAFCIGIVLAILGLVARLPDMAGMAILICLFVGGVVQALGAMKTARYLRDHPADDASGA